MRLSNPELEILPGGSSYDEDNAIMHRSPVPYGRFVRGPDLSFYRSTEKSDPLKPVRPNPLPKLTSSSPTTLTGGAKKSPPPAGQKRERKTIVGGDTTIAVVGRTNAKLPRPLGTARSAKQRLVYTPSQLEGLTDGEKQQILDASEDLKINTEIVKLRDMLVNNQVKNYYANDEDSVALDAVRTANNMMTISLPNINRPHTNGHRRTAAKVKLRDLEEAMESFKTSRKANLEEFYEINAKWFGRPLRKNFRPASVGREERKKNGGLSNSVRPMTEADSLSRIKMEENSKTREQMSSDGVDRRNNGTKSRSESVKTDSSSPRLPSGDDKTSKARVPPTGTKLTMSDLLSLQIRNSTRNGARASTGSDVANGKKRSVRFSVSNEVREYDSNAPVSSPTETTPK